jgi:hypothetical protein
MIRLAQIEVQPDDGLQAIQSAPEFADSDPAARAASELAA